MLHKAARRLIEWVTTGLAWLALLIAGPTALD